MKHKEFGSDFHECTDPRFLLKNPSQSIFNDPSFSFFISGRAALTALVMKGIKEFHWQKIYFPSFYCHEVVEALETLSIECEYYPYNPVDNEPISNSHFLDEEGSVVVDVRYFGSSKASLPAFTHMTIVEDVSHHLLAFQSSKAHYCFASLRKELPIPVGGFCFSPKGFPTPSSENGEETEEIASMKWEAMQLKRQYLEKGLGKKEMFRKLFIKAEQALGLPMNGFGLPETAKEVLSSLDAEEILAAKRENVKIAWVQLKDFLPVALLFINETTFDGFGIFLKCSSLEERNALRSHLIQQQIYPAILWPDQHRDSDLNVENSTLFLHADYRYDKEGVLFMCNTVKEFFRA